MDEFFNLIVNGRIIEFLKGICASPLYVRGKCWVIYCWTLYVRIVDVSNIYLISNVVDIFVITVVK